MSSKKTVEMIAVSDIIPDADQPRRNFDAQKLANLASSIKKHGVLNPLKVQKIGDKFKLVDGERRYRAATSLKMKEVPAIVDAPKSATDTLVEQFQLQELHEGWSASEKAIAAGRLAKEMGLNIADLGRALNQPEKTVNSWIAFSDLSVKKEFVKHDLSLNFARAIRGLKAVARKQFEMHTEQEFTKEMGEKLEQDVVKQIIAGDIAKPNDMTKLKDSIVVDHTNIQKIGKVRPSKMFRGTNAQAAYAFRNLRASAGYLVAHIRLGKAAKGFEALFEGDEGVTISRLKTAHKEIGDLLASLK